MIAGLILTESTDQKSCIAFLGEDTETIELSTNPELIEAISERKPEVIAVDSGTERAPGELTEKESELKEEGHAFTPTSHEKMKSRRLEAIQSELFAEMGAEGPEIIRFEPGITSTELALDSDEALESMGVHTENITSARQFDAVLGAVTARFYQQNQFSDMGVIVPEPLDEN